MRGYTAGRWPQPNSSQDWRNTGKSLEIAIVDGGKDKDCGCGDVRDD